MLNLLDMNRFLVAKRTDVARYLSGDEIIHLEYLLDRINQGRAEDGKGVNEYVCINVDEPYTREVIQTMKRHGVFGELIREEVVAIPITRSKCEDDHPTCYATMYPFRLDNQYVVFINGIGDTIVIAGDKVTDAHFSATVGFSWLSEDYKHFHYIDANKVHRRIPTIII